LIRWAYLLAVPLALEPGAVPMAFAQQPAPVQTQTAAPAYSQAQLEQILAPIALYPDDLLTQVLVASTYPLEVVMASRWVQQPGNRNLKGDALLRALNEQDWDASVKSLVPFPNLLQMMSDQLDWTQKLGDAFLAQQSDVFAAVQALRGRAQAAGSLTSNPQQTVTQEGSAIVIQPAQPDTVYVPAYNPTVAYGGAWPYPAYPPAYYPPPAGAYLGSALVTGLAFGAGVAITRSLWGWGSPNWGNGSINMNVNRFNNISSNQFNNFRSSRGNITSNSWQHNPAHRRGVAYSNSQLKQQFRPSAGANPAQREAFRGRQTAAASGPRQLAQRPDGRTNAPRQGASGRGDLQGKLANTRPDSGRAGNLQGRMQGAPRTEGIGRQAARPQNFQRPDGGNFQARSQFSQRPSGAPAFQGVGNGGATRAQAAQGRASRASMAPSGGRARGGGGMRGGRR
jgi:hypothetical protein